MFHLQSIIVMLIRRNELFNLLLTALHDEILQERVKKTFLLQCRMLWVYI